MVSYIANINTAQVIRKICKEKNMLILNSQEAETDLMQYIKETKVNFNLIKYFIIDLSNVSNSETEIVETIYNYSKIYTKAEIIIIASGFDSQNIILTNLYELGFYNIINEDNIEDKLRIALSVGLQKKDAKKFEKKKEVIVKESKLKNITKKLENLGHSKSKKEITKKEDIPNQSVYFFSLLLEAITRLVKFICYAVVFILTSIGLTILLNSELREIVFKIFGLK